MSELEDILNYLETTSLEPHDDYVSEFSYKKQKILWKYIKDLRLENQELNRENDKLAAKLNKNKILQNEFREWLENKINKLRINISATTTDVYSEYAIPYIKILSRYKEIIGTDNENL